MADVSLGKNIRLEGEEIKNGNMTMQFYLPLKFNKDNSTKPSNSDIKILYPIS